MKWNKKKICIVLQRRSRLEECMICKAKNIYENIIYRLYTKKTSQVRSSAQHVDIFFSEGWDQVVSEDFFELTSIRWEVTSEGMWCEIVGFLFLKGWIRVYQKASCQRFMQVNLQMCMYSLSAAQPNYLLCTLLSRWRRRRRSEVVLG